MKKNIHVLETTLRDGSYSVGNQFNSIDTGFFVKELESSGFEYIEIGSGIGMNAKSKTKLRPAEEDIKYIQAARENARKSKIGMFFIPGIANLEHIDLAAREGLDFLRIGVNVNEIDKAKEFIELSKKRNMLTTVNFMKSYAIPPEKFALAAKEAESMGADIVYIVDSAGGMLPMEVKAYLEAVKSVCPDLTLGFHGHNNLGLAMGNTLQAVISGAEFIDSTIRGIGRSAGNTVTEKLLLALKRMGYDLRIDLEKVLALGDNQIQPFLNNKHENSTDYILGYSQFHSSYVEQVSEVADDFDVDIQQLIVEYSKIDKINIDREKLKEIAGALNTKKSISFDISKNIKYSKDKKLQTEFIQKGLLERKYKFGDKVFFNITKSYTGIDDIKISPVIHFMRGIAFGSAEVTSQEGVDWLEKQFADTVDAFLIDDRISENVDTKKTEALHYNDALLFSKAIYNYSEKITQEFNVKSYYKDINKEISSNLDLTQTSAEEAEYWIVGENFITFDFFKKAKKLKAVLLISPGKLDNKISEDNGNVKLIRIDLEKEVILEIIGKLTYSDLLGENFGKKEINNKMYCSGGYIGKKGTNVVDSIEKITNIYGVSRGDGSIEYNADRREK